LRNWDCDESVRKCHKAYIVTLWAALAAGCGDVSVAGLPRISTAAGELTIFAADAAARTECVEQRVQPIAQAYRNGLLLRVRARVDAAHPRFRAVAESERAELLLPGGTRLFIPLNDRMAAAVDADGGHQLLEIPASIALVDCP
jgi:hypothetical protein